MSYPLWNAFLTMMWFFLWIMWLFLLFRIITDVFRSRDLNGWAKAAWVIFVCVLPFLGVFVYLVARGGDMHERAYDRRYGSQPGANEIEELSTLADLRDKGAITEADFQRAKAKVLR